MDVWFCREQEPKTERHNCAAADLIEPIGRSPERARHLVLEVADFMAK